MRMVPGTLRGVPGTIYARATNGPPIVYPDIVRFSGELVAGPSVVGETVTSPAMVSESIAMSDLIGGGLVN